MKTLIKNKRGQIGLDTVESVGIKFLILAVLGFAIILALVTLSNSNLFTAGSQAANDTNNIQSNVTTSLASFFSNTGTIFNVLVAVVIILAIAIIVGVVRSRTFSGRSGL